MSNESIGGESVINDLESLLPWYLNGSLDDAQRDAVEQWLAESPAAREQLAFWTTAAQDQVRSADRAAEDIGLARVQARIRARSATPLASSAISASWLGALTNWFRSDWLRPAFAASMLVVVVQSGLLLSSKTPMEYRGATPAPSVAEQPLTAARTAYVRVVFDSASTEGQLRFVLAGSGASLVGGPSEAGEYYLAVDAERANQLLEQLKDSGIVQMAAAVAQPPAQEMRAPH